MPLVNLPPSLQTIVTDFDRRVRKLEQSPPKRPYGSWFSTATQTAPSSASVYAVNLNSTAEQNLTSIVSGQKVTVNRTGVYNIQFSAQFQNSAAQDYDIQIWFRHNGIDEPSSNTVLSVPAKHGSVNGSAVAAWNYIIELSAGDYMELYWWAENAAVTMPAAAALTAPVRPAIPSVIVTIQEIAW